MVRNNLCVLGVLLICLIIILPVSLAFDDVYFGGGVNAPEKDEGSAPVLPSWGRYSMTPAQRAELQTAADTGAASAFRRTQQKPRTTLNEVSGIVTGDLSAQFRHVSDAVNRPIVRQEAEIRVRNKALELGVELNNYQVNAFVDNAQKSWQPTTLNKVAATVNAAANTGLVFIGFAAPFASPSVATTISGRVGVYVASQSADITTGVRQVTEDLVQRDVRGAVISGGTAVLGLGTEFATTKLVGKYLAVSSKSAVALSKGSIKGETSRVVKHFVPELINLGTKTAPKLIPKLAAITAGGTASAEIKTLYDNTIISGVGTLSDSQIGEIIKFDDAPIAEVWTDIPSGEEGWGYRKIKRRIGNNEVYALFAKQKSTGEIRVLEGNLKWSKIDYNNGVDFGTNNQIFRQAMTDDWAFVDAGQSQWKYKKHVVGIGEEILYAKDPNGGIRMYDSKKQEWVIPRGEDAKQFLTREAEDYEYQQRILQEERDAINAELPPLDVDYDAPEETSVSVIESTASSDEDTDTEGQEDSTYYYSLEDPLSGGEPEDVEEDGLQYTSSEAFAKLGIIPAEVPEVDSEVAWLAKFHLSEQDISRRTELRDNRLRMAEYLSAPDEGKAGDFEWQYDDVNKKFYAKITLTYVNDNGDLEARLLTFSNPGTFIQLLEEFKNEEHLWGEEVWKTINQIDLVLWQNGWKKKETADLDKPTPRCGEG